MGECLKTNLRPPLGLTSPPHIETAVPSAYEHSEAFCSDIGCSVTISVMISTTPQTSPLPNIKWHFTTVVIAIRTELEVFLGNLRSYDFPAFHPNAKSKIMAWNFSAVTLNVSHILGFKN
jgi:hypothetical protein